MRARCVPDTAAVDDSTTDGVTLRRAAAGDAEQVGRFQTTAWDQSYRGIVPDAVLDATTWQERAARWHDRIVGGTRDVWLAHRDGRLVGVASTAPTDGDRPDLPALELATIYVDAAAHGTGVAGALLDAALGDAPAHLWVFAANGRAQRFYVKHGFRATGEAQVDPGTGLEEVRWVRG